MRELANGVTTNKTVRRVHRRPIRRGGPHSVDARTSSLAAYFLCVLRKLSRRRPPSCTHWEPQFNLGRSAAYERRNELKVEFTIFLCGVGKIESREWRHLLRSVKNGFITKFIQIA